jgi:hypothetical protein
MVGLLAINTEGDVDFTDTQAVRTAAFVCMGCGLLRLHDWQILSD